MRRRAYRGQIGNSLLAIIGINLIVYIVTLFQADLKSILALQPASLAGEPWTIVTSMFVHAGLWHLLANMLTLYFFGRALLAITGEKWFMTVYLLGGIAGGLLFTLFAYLFGYSYSLVIGASGAIFAVMGAMTMMQPKARVMIFPIPVPIPLWAAVIGGFVLLSLIGLIGNWNIAWEAHLGGLLVGLAAGYLFRRKRRIIFF